MSKALNDKGIHCHELRPDIYDKIEECFGRKIVAEIWVMTRVSILTGNIGGVLAQYVIGWVLGRYEDE